MPTTAEEAYAAARFKGGSVAREMARQVAASKPGGARLLNKLAPKHARAGAKVTESMESAGSVKPWADTHTDTQPVVSEEPTLRSRPASAAPTVTRRSNNVRTSRRDERRPASAKPAAMPRAVSRERASSAQSGLVGPAAPVNVAQFDFDRAHPTLAFKHFDRSKDEESYRAFLAEQKVMLAEAKALRTQSLSPSKAKGGGGAAPKAAPTCRLEGKGKREEERRIVHRRAAAQRPPKVAGSMTAFFQAATQKAEHADDGALPDSRDGWRELLLGAIDDDAEEEEEEEVWLPPRTGLPRGSRTRSKSPPGTAYRREMTVFAETQRRSTEHSKSPSRKAMTPTRPKPSKVTEAPLQAEQQADASLSWVERAKRAHLPQVSPPSASDATVAAVAAGAAAGAMTPAADASTYVAHLEAKISSLQASITDLRSSMDTTAPAPSAASRGTLADHLAAANAGGGDAVDPTAAFSAQRFAEYNARVDAQMEARRAAGHYDSDEEHDPRPAAPPPAAEVAAPAAALTDEAKAMRKWLEESDWMDAYRQEAEQEAAATAAEPVAAVAAGRDSVEELRAKVPLDELLAADSALLEGLLAAYREANAQALGEEEGGDNHLTQVTQYFSDGDVDWPEPHELSGRSRQGARRRSAGGNGGAYPTEAKSAGHRHHGGCVHYLGAAGAGHGDGLPRPAAKALRIKPKVDFSFNHVVKPKTIMQERLEQDLLLRAETDHAVNGPRPFKAKPIPKSTLEPRYAFLQEAALFRREQNVKQRKAQIESQGEVFSFQTRDEVRQAEKAKVLDEKRKAQETFAPFKANDVPLAVLEPRYHLMAVMDERRKQVRKELAAAKFAQAKLPPRMEIHKEAEKEKSAKAKEEVLPPFKPQVRLGYVPNFDELHTNFQEELLARKQAAQVTTPKPFKLHNERVGDIAAKVIKDMEKDEDELPETRWPFFPGGRRKVAPTPVPAVPPLSQAELESLENKSARQRRLAIEQARRAGVFDDRQQKEAKAANKRIKQAESRAEAWVKAQRRIMEARGVMDPALSYMSDDQLKTVKASDVPAASSSAAVAAAATTTPTPAVTPAVKPTAAPAAQGTAEVKAEGEADGKATAAAAAPAKTVEKKAPTGAGMTTVTPQHVDARLKQEEAKAKEIVEQILLKNDVYTYLEEEG